MGAIAGILYFGQARGAVAALPAMMEAMKRRGPDDEGFAVFPDGSAAPILFGGQATPEDAFKGALPYHPRRRLGEGELLPDARLALAQRRLAVLDLSPRGHQPMSSPDGRYWIVSEGTVYNFRELRSELEAEAFQFTTETDTEVMLAAFARWGAASLNRFNGCFACAIWDRQTQRLFCARDRLGLKPFYYHVGPEYLVFASQIDALLASRLFPAEPDPNGLYHSMVLQMSPRPMTAFKGISMLRNGHFMWIDPRGDISERIYWSMPFGLTDHRRSEDSYAKELEEILKRSVARALVSDVPVGTFISGGVDSTLASALAARLRPGIKSFTLSHPDAGEVDEVANARATAAMHNITLVEVPSTDGFKMAWDAELVRALEEPWLSLDAGFLLTPVAAQHGMKVMVGASGVDQCFMGFRYEQRIQYWDWCRRFAPVLGALPPWGGRLNSLRRWASLPTLAHVYAYRFSCLSGALLPEECEQMFDPSFLSRVEQRDTAQVLMDIYSFDENRYEDRIQGMTALDISTFLCNRLLRDVDQEAGYSGVEARSIALDQEFLEFTARLPVELKIRDGSRKYLMRRIAKPYIHPNCLIQGKHRHNTPMERWLAGPLKEFALEKLAALEKISIFHPQALGTARFQISNSDVAWPRCNRIWQMVSTQCWLEGSFAGGSGSE